MAFVISVAVVTSFNHLKPPERDLTLMSHMKSIKSLRHAGFTAVFTGQTVSRPTLQDKHKPCIKCKIYNIIIYKVADVASRINGD